MNSLGDGTITLDTQGLKHIDEEQKVTRFAEANPPWPSRCQTKLGPGVHAAFYLNHSEAEAAKSSVRTASTTG